MLSCSVMSDSLWPPWTVACQAPLSAGIRQARILEWVAMLSSRGSSQPRDQTQGSNPGLPHCRWILYRLSHQESPRILVSYPFSRGPSQPRNQTESSCIAGGFFTSWATRELPGTTCYHIRGLKEAHCSFDYLGCPEEWPLHASNKSNLEENCIFVCEYISQWQLFLWGLGNCY